MDSPLLWHCRGPALGYSNDPTAYVPLRRIKPHVFLVYQLRDEARATFKHRRRPVIFPFHPRIRLTAALAVHGDPSVSKVVNGS